jgi:hypothetical protein
LGSRWNSGLLSSEILYFSPFLLIFLIFKNST